MTFSFIPEQRVDVPPIEYKPRVELPAAQSALIVIDMQNDFVHENGSLVCPPAKQTVPRILSLLEAARSSGAHVIYTQDTQIEDDPEFQVWPEHCVKGTWGWRIIEDLQPQDGELICPKNRYDGFYGTWLDHFLDRVWQVQHVVIVGTVANICVLHTAASAGLRWYDVTIPADGISALTAFDQALTLRQASYLYNGSVVKSTADIGFQSG